MTVAGVTCPFSEPLVGLYSAALTPVRWTVPRLFDQPHALFWCRPRSQEAAAADAAAPPLCTLKLNEHEV